MAMIEEYWYEFSKLYARLMRLEIGIKRSAFYAVTKYYKGQSLYEFRRFFKNKRRKERYVKNKKLLFDEILNNKQINDIQKFQKLLDILYISDLLNFVLKTKEFAKEEILNDFYYKMPENMLDLSMHIDEIKELRNCVAHFKFEQYKINKKKYLDTLLNFEIHNGHNIIGVLELPKLKNKPSAKEILNSIHKLKPDLIEDFSLKKATVEPYYYNTHRLLLSLYDDIALYNGYTAKELPSPWTILRQMYRVKSEIKKKIEKNNSDENYTTGQIKINFC